MAGPLEEVEHGHVGKFPVWAIAVAIAGAVILFVVIRKRSASKVAAAPSTPDVTGDQPAYTDPTLSDTSSYGLPGGPIGSYLSNDPTNSAYPVGLTPQGIPGPVTNQQWARLAADELIAKGDDPTLVNNALSKFISGAQLDAAEQAVVNLALTILGQPPEGVIPVQVVTGGNGGSGTGGTSGSGTPPPKPTPPPPAPKKRRSVTVARYTGPNGPWNSTLGGIAAHFGTTVENLAEINHISNPNRIFTGQTIWIDPA